MPRFRPRAILSLSLRACPSNYYYCSPGMAMAFLMGMRFDLWRPRINFMPRAFKRRSCWTGRRKDRGQAGWKGLTTLVELDNETNANIYKYIYIMKVEGREGTALRVHGCSVQILPGKLEMFCARGSLLFFFFFFFHSRIEKIGLWGICTVCLRINWFH